MQITTPDIYSLVRRLYPICRSITGEGVRETLAILREIIPLEVHEVPSGAKVFDWVVPKEWNIHDAYIKNLAGQRLVDFKASNLHVMSYSTPIDRRMTLSELRPHLFTVPSHPDWIPYRTSYYEENWGFCLSEKELAALREDEEYEVRIDSSLTNGHLAYGEYFLPGETDEEVLFSAHICHPSLANDNLSGVAVAVALAEKVSASPGRYSYRFLFVPGTIGAITWLALNETSLKRIRHGLVLTSVGDAAGMTYKRSRRGEAEIDRAFGHLLRHSPNEYKIVDFAPYGYDERQYCSPGINLPVGCLMRSIHGTFPEYHTSADNLNFVSSGSLDESYRTCIEVIDILEHNRRYINHSPKGEPQLGRRGLYQGLSGNTKRREYELALLWVLNFSDGTHSLLDIAERANLPFASLKAAADALAGTDLLTLLA